MTEPKKHELEAVAFLYPALSGGVRAGVGPPSERDETPLTSLPAAQALLAERDERIEELEDRIATAEDEIESLESSNRSLSEVLNDLESRLARWRPIARAAARFIDEMDWSYQRNPPPEYEELIAALNTLPEPERSELLEGGEDG